MEIGPFIKLHRLKQNMTQADLAEGIVSTAYLSKIENQRTEATPDVIRLLCTRLGIQLDNVTEETIRDKCQEWYDMLFDINDKQEIIDRFNELNSLVYEYHSDSLVMFEIHKIRYYLVIGELDQALDQINKLAELRRTFDVLHQYYWYKFKGNYSSLKTDFKQAMQMYELAEEALNQLRLSEAEKADLQYVIAVTHSKLRNMLEAIEYAEKAINIFRKHYNFLRCAQCHIVLGISYRRITLRDKAIKNYKLAKNLGELTKNQEIIQLANQNLGHLYSTIGETDEAVTFFEEIIANDEIRLIEKIAAAASLIKEYYSNYNYDKAKEMVEQNKALLKKAYQDDNDYIFYNYVTKTYDYVLHNKDEQFERLVTDEFLPFLIENNYHVDLAIYSAMAARFFEKRSRYEEAVKYYRLSNDSYGQIANL